MKIYLKAISAALILATLNGCCALKPWNQDVNITTYPAGAKLEVNGETYTSPAIVSCRRNKSVNIYARKDGYEPRTRSVGTQISPVMILDVVGGILFLVPLVGLAFPGTMDLETTTVNLHLDPVTSN